MDSAYIKALTNGITRDTYIEITSHLKFSMILLLND